MGGFLKKIDPSRAVKKVMTKKAEISDKLFSENLARQYRSIDPIARMMGEKYQRHVFGLFTGTTPTSEYYGNRDRGMTKSDATRVGYQNVLKSVAIWVTIWSAVSAWGGAGGAAEGGAGAGAAGAEGAAGTGYAGAEASAIAAENALASGATAAEVQAGANTALGYTQATGVAAETAAVAGSQAAAEEGGKKAAQEGAKKGGDGLFSNLWQGAKDEPVLALGLLQAAGSALSEANTPSEAEEYAEILEAKRRANRYGESAGQDGQVGTFTQSRQAYVAPRAAATPTLNPQQLLAAGGMNQTGLLETTPAEQSVIARAGYG